MKNPILFFLILLYLEIDAQSQITWNMGMNIATSSSGNEHPRLVVNGSGNPIVLWGHANRAMFSRWNGSAFTTPVMLNPMTMTIAEASWMGPDMAAHGDTIYVVMKQTPEADTSSHIYIVRSFDGGVTFSPPFQVDNIGDSVSRFPTVTTDDSGNPIVGFMKFNSTFGDARWVVTKSGDYGNTFTNDVKASGWSAAGSTVCDCCPGSIIYDVNNVAMLYRDNNNNIRDSWLGISNNAGASFTAGCNVDQNNWMIMMCPSTGPDGIIIGDSVYSVFMNGASSIGRVYRSVSSLSNATSQPGQSITGNIPGLASQNYPRIAANGNAVAMVWQQNVSGNTQLPMLFTNDISNGFPAAYDTVDLNSITNADVAVTNGKIFVVWEDDASGTVKFRSGTFTPSTSTIDENNFQSLFSIAPNPANNVVAIQCSRGITNIAVTDVTQREIFAQQIPLQNNIQINTSVWNNGIYLVTAKNKFGSFSKKIVIEHN